jgi:hypothetical protein
MAGFEETAGRLLATSLCCNARTFMAPSGKEFVSRSSRGGSVPIRYHIRSDLRLVVLIHIGSVTDQEFLSGYQDLAADPRFCPDLDRLVDLRQTDSSARSIETLRSLAARVRNRYEGIDAAPRTAVIATHDVSFGLARLFEALTDVLPGEFIVVRTADEALAWLGISSEMLPELEAGKNRAVG